MIGNLLHLKDCFNDETVGIISNVTNSASVTLQQYLRRESGYHYLVLKAENTARSICDHPPAFVLFRKRGRPGIGRIKGSSAYGFIIYRSQCQTLEDKARVAWRANDYMETRWDASICRQFNNLCQDQRLPRIENLWHVLSCSPAPTR